MPAKACTYLQTQDAAARPLQQLRRLRVPAGRAALNLYVTHTTLATALVGMSRALPSEYAACSLPLFDDALAGYVHDGARLPRRALARVLVRDAGSTGTGSVGLADDDACCGARWRTLMASGDTKARAADAALRLAAV